jgi:hemolysin III
MNAPTLQTLTITLPAGMHAPMHAPMAAPRPFLPPSAHADGQPHAPQEEFANALSHVAGVVMACAALPILASSVAPGQTARLVGVIVFALTMLAAYLASSIFHAMPAGRTRAWLRRLDHAAIYVFIAGSFTPFAMAAEASADRVVLLGAIWLLALLGAGLKLVNRLRHRSASTLAYLVFGWMVLALAQPILVGMNGSALSLLMLGAAAYSVGCVFFMLDRRLRFGHFVWHLLVLGGSACHLMAVLQACCV